MTLTCRILRKDGSTSGFSSCSSRIIIASWITSNSTRTRNMYVGRKDGRPISSECSIQLLSGEMSEVQETWVRVTEALSRRSKDGDVGRW